MTQANVVTTITGEQRVAFAMKSGEAYSQSGLFALDAKNDALQALEGCDFPMYESIRDIWKKAYRADQNGNGPDVCTEDAAKMAWSRFCKEIGYTIPKSTSTEATESAKRREAEKAKLATLKTEEVATAREQALRLAADSIAVADLKKSEEATRSVKAFDAELKRRHDEANKPLLEAMAKKRDAIRKALNTCTDAQLDAISALLNIGVETSNGQTVQSVASAPLVTEGRPKRHREQATM